LVDITPRFAADPLNPLFQNTFSLVLPPWVEVQAVELDGLVADLAAAGPALEEGLEQLDCPGQGQAGRGAKGWSRSRVRKPWAALTRAV
jgi:hypothetical protein